MRKLLIVEDDPDAAELMRTIFELEGYEVGSASDGRDALEQLCAPKKPCAVVVDLRMAGMGGEELVQLLRTSEATARMPIVVATAMDPARTNLPDDVTVLRKPFESEDLVRAVGAACRGD